MTEYTLCFQHFFLTVSIFYLRVYTKLLQLSLVYILGMILCQDRVITTKCLYRSYVISARLIKMTKDSEHRRRLSEDGIGGQSGYCSAGGSFYTKAGITWVDFLCLTFRVDAANSVIFLCYLLSHPEQWEVQAEEIREGRRRKKVAADSLCELFWSKQRAWSQPQSTQGGGSRHEVSMTLWAVAPPTGLS